MKRIFFVPALAALTLLGFYSNAKGTNSPDAKTTDAVASPSEGSTQTQVNYFWFTVDPSTGDLTSMTAKSSTATATDPDGCQGNGDYCGRAYLSTQTHISGGQRVLNSDVDETDAAEISRKD